MDIVNIFCSETLEYNTLEAALNRLPIAVGASFESDAEDANPKCLTGTRVELLEEIME